MNTNRVPVSRPGRRNWLFFGSEAGGATAAILFSLTETCKRLGVEPWAYLRDVLDRLSTHPASRIEDSTHRASTSVGLDGQHADHSGGPVAGTPEETRHSALISTALLT